MKPSHVRFLLLFALPTGMFSILAGEAGSTVVASEPERTASRRILTADTGEDWPHWRGPNRNGTVAQDSGWDAGHWPPRAPLWEATVGVGGTSPLVVGERVYVLGWTDGRDTLRCLDAASGRELWRGSYAAPKYGRHATGDEGLYAGVTATPEYDPDSGRLYTLGIDGHLACWNAQDGNEMWSLNLYDVYGVGRRDKIGRSGRRDYGYTASPLVHGDWLIVEVGSSRGTVIALDKRTGREVWASRAAHQAGHSGGPVPITVEGIPCAAVFALKHLLVVRLDRGHEGETLAEYPWETEFAQNIATPAVWQNRVLITAGYNHQSLCLLEITRQGARKVWEQPSYSQVCSPLIHAGCIYWVYQSPVCLDLETGRKIWEGPRRFGDAGSCVVTSDERLILWTGRGDLVLAETARRAPGEYRELARTPTLFGTDVWPHVTLAGGRVFCKDRDGHMVCFAFERSAAEAPPMLVVSTPPGPPPGAAPRPAAPPPAAAPGPPLDLAALATASGSPSRRPFGVISGAGYRSICCWATSTPTRVRGWAKSSGSPCIAARWTSARSSSETVWYGLPSRRPGSDESGPPGSGGGRCGRRFPPEPGGPQFPSRRNREAISASVASGCLDRRHQASGTVGQRRPGALQLSASRSAPSLAGQRLTESVDVHFGNSLSGMPRESATPFP